MNKPTKNGKMQVSIDNDNSLFIYTHDTIINNRTINNLELKNYVIVDVYNFNVAFVSFFNPCKENPDFICGWKQMRRLYDLYAFYYFIYTIHIHIIIFFFYLYSLLCLLIV